VHHSSPPSRTFVTKSRPELSSGFLTTFRRFVQRGEQSMWPKSKGGVRKRTAELRFPFALNPSVWATLLGVRVFCLFRRSILYLAP
jgi:hypothetical protein